MATFTPRLGAHRGAPSRHAARPGRQASRGWFGALRDRLVSAGAVAGALAAVLGLVGVHQLWPVRDAEDVAEVAGLSVTSPMSLGDYLQISRSGATVTAPRTRRMSELIVMTPAPADDAGSAADETEPPASALPAPGAPAGNAPADEPPTTGPTSATGAPPLHGAFTALNASRQGAYLVRTQDRQGFDDLVDGTSTQVLHQASNQLVAGLPHDSQDLRTVVAPMVRSIQQGDTRIGSRAAARRVLAVLQRARRDPRTHQPLGALVAVQIRLEGLRGVPLDLTWSMFRTSTGAQLNTSWLNRNLAYRVTAGTDHDSAGVDIWIPVPKQRGPFVVQVDVGHGGSTLASAQTRRFD